MLHCIQGHNADWIQTITRIMQGLTSVSFSKDYADLNGGGWVRLFIGCISPRRSTHTL